VPQVRVDVLMKDEDVAIVMESIRHSQCKFRGKGIYWISNLPEMGEL
jgi:hypothetical protein